MDVTFPGESAEYRAARDRLLDQEIELRRATEAVAEARRRLPPGGIVPKDYVFRGRGADGKSADVHLSELFSPGKDSLVVYSMMFPRDPEDNRPGPEGGHAACYLCCKGRVPRARHCSINSTVPWNTRNNGSTWRSSVRRRCRSCLASRRTEGGGDCDCCRRPTTRTTGIISARRPMVGNARC